ncbi:MAG: putative membrane protein YfcA [Halioglobus sp.]|jgi:uncharacterized membrane protein YfcA
MNGVMFKTCLLLISLLFTTILCYLVIPPLIENPNIIEALAAGFVNPFAAGYSTDVFFCWFVLAVWVWFEASNLDVKHGWVCLILGVVPGVAVGFALYLLIRQSQLKSQESILK